LMISFCAESENVATINGIENRRFFILHLI